MTSPSGDRPVFSVMVNTSEMQGSVRSIDVEDHDRLIDRVQIITHDPTRAISDNSNEGQKVVIEMGWGNQRTPVFEGYVVRATSTDNATTNRTVTLTALDPSYFMNLQVRVPRGFPPRGGTARLSEIINQVVSEGKYPRKDGTQGDYAELFTVGKILVDNDVEFTSSSRLLQRNETDLQFLYRLANLYGARTFVEYNRVPGQTTAASQFYFISERKLMEGDRLATLRYCKGVSEILEFRADRVSSDAQPQRRGVLVNPTNGIAAEATPAISTETGTSSPDIADQISYLERQGRSAAGYRERVEAAVNAPVQPGDLSHHYADTGLPSNPNLIETITRQDPTRILGLRGNGKAVGNVLLRAKSKIGIIGFSIWDDGDWYVHKVNHKITQEGEANNPSFTTLFEVSR
jgi:hypothetical protein